MTSIYGAFGTNSARLPFIVVANNGTFPYLGTPTYMPPGPFQNQTSNISTYNVDACMLDFV